METERDRNARRGSAPLVLGYATVCYAAVLGYANRDLGGAYARYQAHVPALVPGIRPRSQPHGSMQPGGVR
ncbi:MAG TPA: hypothetical protein VK836_10000 [Streptosporangiaceae bacterium]|nr:hypothetical protein [Streptosporangiaceae bacterium]